jgi:hypothetical protein
MARRVARRVKHGLDEPLVRFTRLRDAPGLLVGHNQVLGRSVDHLTTLECVAVATGVLDSSTHWDRCHRVAAQWDSKANGAPITAFHPMEWRRPGLALRAGAPLARDAAEPSPRLRAGAVARPTLGDHLPALLRDPHSHTQNFEESAHPRDGDGKPDGPVPRADFGARTVR